MARARAAVDRSFPGQTEVGRYGYGDNGERPAEQIVTWYWVRRSTGPGYRIVSTRLTEDGHVRVGVTGDVDAARRHMDEQFPGRTEVFADKPLMLW